MTALSKADSELIEAATRRDPQALPLRLAGGRRGDPAALGKDLHRRQPRRLSRPHGGLRRSGRARAGDHGRRRVRHRHRRRGAPSAAGGKGPAGRGGVALRRLPRADLGLRSQRPRHRAGAGRADRRSASANCCRTNTAASEETERDHHAQPPGHRRTPRGRRGRASLRPQRLAEFIGQQQARANLSVFIEAARARNEALDHVLLVGPPGLGKTTLAQIVSRELGVNFRATSGPVIAKAGDLAALLTNLEERDVLFIDEIHRLNPAVEEILYPAMEDFQLDLIIGEGPAARSVKIDLAKFTLVGATTRAGLLTNPLRDRFGIPVRLNFYTEAELELIVNRGARVLGIGMTRGRRQRDRAPLARHAAHRRPAAAPRARLRPCRQGRQDRPQARRQGAARARGRRRRPRRDGPPLSHDHRRELRRRAGRRRDAGRRAVGAARRHRGDHRAVPDPEGLPAAHAARPADHRARVQASRPRRAGARSVAVRAVRNGG